MLPTVWQRHATSQSFPRRRVDAYPQLDSLMRGGDGLRVQVAVAVRGARSRSFLPLRARKAVMDAGNVRDGP